MYQRKTNTQYTNKTKTAIQPNSTKISIAIELHCCNLTQN